MRQTNVDLESEGEAGDSGAFANWTGNVVESGKPLPKFEKSVFNMKYDQHKQMQQTGKSNQDEESKKRRDRTKKRNESKDGNKEAEVLPHQLNRH